MSAPPRLSDLHGTARLDALYRRHAANQAQQRAELKRRPTLLQRVREVLRG